MAITKYASFEVNSILDVKGSAERQTNASLSRVSSFEDFRTEDGYLYARIRAISSRVNKNHDGWPSVELAGGPDAFDRYKQSGTETGFTVNASKDETYGFSTFLGKPIFVDHHNSDPSRARGVIVDAKLHVEDHKTAAMKDSYYHDAPVNHCPPTWVELLLEVDAKSFPKLAKAIINGSRNAKHGIDGFSMGCDVRESVCNICKNSATTPEDFCNHVRMKGAHFDYYDDMGRKTSKKAYEDCYGIKFFEISAVFDPADETALIREVRSSTEKESCPDCGNSGECPKCKHEKGVKERPYTEEELARNLDKTENEDVKVKQKAWIKKHKESAMNKVTTSYGDVYEFTDVPAISGMSGDEVRDLNGDFEISDWKNHGLIVYDVTEGTSWFVDIDDFNIALKDGRAVPLSQEGITIEGSMNKFAPIGEYDKYFGGKPGSAKKAKDSMIDQYGEEKGKEVFYATMNKKKNEKEAAQHEAGNPKPQSEKTHAPESIDTLRKEKVCEVCGSDMEGPQCDVCGWESEPEGFDNPDLEKAKKRHKKDKDDEGHGEHDKHHKHDKDHEDDDSISSLEIDNTKKLPTVAHITDTDQDFLDPKVAQINKMERPVLAVQRPASNEPKDHIVKDQDKPNTSSVRTASDFVAAAGKNKRNNMETQHTADATSTAPAVAKPEFKTDVTDIGGIGDATNEGASSANTHQVSVTDIGGISGAGIGNEKTVEVAQGNENSKNIEAIHTDTFGPNDGDSLGQHDPVTDVSSYQVFNSDSATALTHHETPAKASSWVVSDVRTADVNGASPADPMGNADERIDVSHGDPHSITTQDSGPTKTWTGIDGNGVTRQQDPVTDTSFYDDQNSKEFHPTGVGSNDHAFGKGSSAHIMSAFKLADTEIELGLLDPSHKYERIAELEQAAPSVVEASLEYASRVKTAGLKKAVKTAKRLPSMAKGAAVDASKSQPEEPEDFALFM